jgi:hypothetical protein
MSSFFLASGTLILALGQSATVPTHSSQIWFSQEDSISAQVLDTRVVLKAKKLGRTFATGLDSKSDILKVDVYSSGDFQKLNGCARNLVSFDTYPAQFRFSPKESERLLKNCALSQLSPPVEDPKNEWKTFDEESEKKLADAGISFSRQSQTTLLAAFVVQKSLVKRARETLGTGAAFYTWVAEEPTSKPGRTLLFDVALLEVSTSKLESLGVSLPDHLNFSKLSPRPALNPVLLKDLGLSFAAFEGIGKILSQPRLRVRPGDKAHFQSGGEIPIKSVSSKSASVAWKPHGLLLEVAPSNQVETGSSSISVHFQIELSEPDFSVAVDGIPGMRSRKIESTFDLRTNEATVLGALTQSRDSEKSKGPWGLKWIPIIGTLLSQSDTLSQNTELWFVVKPTWEEIPLARFSQLEHSKVGAQ